MRRAQDDAIGLVVKSDVIGIAALAAVECVLITVVGSEALMPECHCAVRGVMGPQGKMGG